MGAIAGFGPAVYGLYKGMDDQTRLDQERQQSQFNLEEAKRRSTAEQELQPLRIRQAKGAIDLQDAETAQIPLRTTMLKNQGDLYGLNLKNATDEFALKAAQRKSQEDLDAAHRALMSSGDYSGFQNFLGKMSGGTRNYQIQSFNDETGAGITVGDDKGQTRKILNNAQDFTTALGIPAQLPAEQKLSFLAQHMAQPSVMAALLQTQQNEERKHKRALEVEEAKTTRAENVADIRATSAERNADVRASATIAAIGGRDAAAEKKQTKKDADNYQRSYTAETKRIASVRGTTGPLAKMINNSDVLISQAMPTLRKKVQQDYPDLQGDQAAQKAWDIAETQLSAAISQVQRKPETKLAVERQMRDAGWSEEAVRAVSAKVPK